MARALPSFGQTLVLVTTDQTPNAMACRAISCCASTAVTVGRSVQRRVRPDSSFKSKPASRRRTNQAPPRRFGLIQALGRAGPRSRLELS